MTETDIRKLLFTINSVYPTFKVENPEQMVKIWFEFLGDQDPIAIGMSLKNYIRTSKSDFAPSIGQLIQGAYDLKNKDELNAADAWNLVIKAIRRSTYYAEDEFKKLPVPVQKAVGSPWQLRAWASDSGFNEGVASSNFRRAYATICERQKQEALMSPDIKQFIESSMDVRLLKDGE